MTYLQILKEEFLEAACEAEPQELLAELIDVAAVAQDWMDAILRRTAGATPPAQMPPGRDNIPPDHPRLKQPMAPE